MNKRRTCVAGTNSAKLFMLHFFKKGLTPIIFFDNYNFTFKGFRRIRTRTVRIEGNHADHLTLFH